MANRLRLSSRVILDGLLTAAQLEGALRACAQHELFLPSGARRGFFLGDGAGVGKGRQQAAVILHNLNHGRRRAAWFSVSADLIDDARRDLRDLGAGGVRCHDLRDYRVDENLSRVGELGVGILFCTYALLVTGRSSCRSRLAQVLKYLGHGFDGVLTFDEIHRAKNLGLEEGGRGRVKGSRTAEAVRDLQEQLPLARVLYARCR
jgi:hypothetical protein